METKTILLDELYKYPMGTKIQIDTKGIFYIIGLIPYDIELFDGKRKVLLSELVEDDLSQLDTLHITFKQIPTNDILRDILQVELAYLIEDGFNENEIKILIEKISKIKELL